MEQPSVHEELKKAQFFLPRKRFTGALPKKMIKELFFNGFLRKHEEARNIVTKKCQNDKLTYCCVVVFENDAMPPTHWPSLSQRVFSKELSQYCNLLSGHDWFVTNFLVKTNTSDIRNYNTWKIIIKILKI